MRKLKFVLAAIFALMLFCVPSGFCTAYAAEKQYYVGGMAAGFFMSAGGAQVIGFNEVRSQDGVHRPAQEAGIKTGDTICSANGINISSTDILNEILDKSKGEAVELTVKRGGDMATVCVSPVKEVKSGRYKIGVLVRDSISGIGTVTYIEKDTLCFGALGHGVTDENRESMKISDSRVYLCSVIGVKKGSRGQAGELRGLFMNDRAVGCAERVGNHGLFGHMEKSYDLSNRECVTAATVSEATIGKAYIYSTIDGISPQKYEIAIAKVDSGNRENKNFVIKVTDERLISQTGGIVQGMSGSPILQNGKLIGAVTHVFVIIRIPTIANDTFNTKIHP